MGISNGIYKVINVDKNDSAQFSNVKLQLR